MARRPKPAANDNIPEAVSYFRNKGTQPSFDWKDVAPEEHAFVFTVAKATQVEVLGSIQQAVEEAIAKGETPEMFKAKLEPKLRQLGWWGRKTEVDPVTGEVKSVQLGSARRLDTIYWANTRTAWAAGAWERAQRTKGSLPYFVYLLGPSEVHRVVHAAWAGQPLILKVDDPTWNTLFPPNAWGCKCWTRQITEKEAIKLGYKPGDGPPKLTMRTYTNERTGETRSIPVGVDPGWESNPGALRLRNLGRHIAGKLDDAPPQLRNVAIRDTISSATFQRIQAREIKGVAPVGVVSEKTSKALGTSTRTVLFSSDTADKQAGFRPSDHPGRPSRGHPEVNAQDYLKVQAILDSGNLKKTADNHLTGAATVDGRIWSATFKATRDGKEIYLQSFRPGNRRDLERAR